MDVVERDTPLGCDGGFSLVPVVVGGMAAQIDDGAYAEHVDGLVQFRIGELTGAVEPARIDLAQVPNERRGQEAGPGFGCEAVENEEAACEQEQSDAERPNARLA